MEIEICQLFQKVSGLAFAYSKEKRHCSEAHENSHMADFGVKKCLTSEYLKHFGTLDITTIPTSGDIDNVTAKHPRSLFWN